MAISKTSSLNTAASQQQKPQISDLMESIKAATMKNNKDPFRNLLTDITSMATKTQESQGRLEISPNSSRTRTHDNFIDAPKEKTTCYTTETHPEKLSENESEDNSFAECSQEIALETVYPELSSAPPVQPINFDKSQLEKITTSNPVFLTTKDQEIKNWIDEGRVVIEKLPTIDPSNQQLQPPAALITLRASDNAESEQLKENSTMDSQLIKLDNFKESIDVKQPDQSTTTKFQVTTPVHQITAIPVAAAQDMSSTDNTIKNKAIAGDFSTHSLHSQSSVTQGGKLGKAATLSAFDKLAALNQIKEQLRQSLQKGETHLNIQLKPDELGKVEIKLDITRDGIVSALFKAENRETLEVLNRHSQDFQNLFQDAGLQTDSQGMSFSMSHQQEEAFADTMQPHKKQFEENDDIDVIPTQPIRTLSSTSSVDISV